MVKICFVLPSLLKATSPIVGISILISYLSYKYNITVIGVLDNSKPHSLDFGQAKIVFSKSKNIFKKITILKQINADIYISSLLQADLLTAFIKEKKISLIRSDILKSYLYDKGKIVGLSMYLLHIVFLSSYNRIIALTKQNSRRLILNNKNNIFIVRNFFDESLNKSINTPLNKNLNLLFAGHLSLRKGIINLIRIINELDNEGYNIKLTILGNGNLQSKIDSYINKNKLNDKICLMGFVDNVSHYIEKSNYTILPSFSEGISRFILESLYIGRKAIVRNTSGIDEVLNNGNSYIFNSDNDLKNLLIQLIETKKYLDDPCKKYPRDFDKNINLKKIEKIIIDLHLN